MYTPISPVSFPTLLDSVISVEKEMFSQVPQLSFLMGRYEAVTASSLYYDPLDPQQSQRAGVSYLRTRLFTTLSEQPLKLRHLGSSADMEIAVDTYVYVPKGPDFGEYSSAPRAFQMREGDRYERTSSAYVYHAVPVPQKSSLVWDGRYSICVDASGNEVEPYSRLDKVRGEARAALEDPGLVPYTVLSLGGFAHTVKEPNTGSNKSKYDSSFNQFLVDSYNALSIPPVPRSSDGATGNVARYENSNTRFGTGRYGLTRTTLAAELNGDYFVRWVRYEVYTETNETQSGDQ